MAVEQTFAKSVSPCNRHELLVGTKLRVVKMSNSTYMSTLNELLFYVFTSG